MTASTPFTPAQSAADSTRASRRSSAPEAAAAVPAVATIPGTPVFEDLLWSPVAAFTLDGLAARAGDTFPTWAIARVSTDDWTLIASTGDVANPTGTTTPWQESLCSQLQHSEAAVMAADLRRVRSPAVRARAKSHRVRSYIGAPLLAGDGTRLGSLCAWSADPTRDDQPLRAQVTAQACFLGHTLTRQLARNHTHRLQEWSSPTLGRDPVTGLVDPDAFELLLQREDERSRELADPAIITVIDLPAASARTLKRLARDLNETVTTINAVTGPYPSAVSRTTTATAVAARTGTTEFTVLSTGAPTMTAGAITQRLISDLAAATPRARTSSAHRRGTTPLADVWATARAGLLTPT